MLRNTGLLALLASTILAVLLFGRVQTLRLTGILQSGGDIAPLVLAVRGPNAPALKDEDFPALEVNFRPGPAGGLIVYLSETEEIAEQLETAGGTHATLTHRWLTFGALREPFGATRIEEGGRSYTLARSTTEFFRTLTLLSAGPSLLWLLAASPSLLQRRSKPPGSVA